MHIHARSLGYFDMIRKCGSIRGAARRLHVASSAVNRQLLQLEEEVGTPLFERLAGGLRLTAAGEVFAQHVITVLQDAQRLGSDLEALREGWRGSLHVTASDGLQSTFIARVMQQMLLQYPRLELTVNSATSAEMSRALADGDTDAAVGFTLPRRPEIRQVAMGRFMFGAVVAPGHALASQANVTFAECAAFPLILATPELQTHSAMQPLLQKHTRPLQVTLQTGSIDLMKALAASGAGVAFQTRMGMERELQQGTLVHVPLKLPGRLYSELGVHVRSGRSLPATLDAFLRFAAAEIDLQLAQEAGAR